MFNKYTDCHFAIYAQENTRVDDAHLYHTIHLDTPAFRVTLTTNVLHYIFEPPHDKTNKTTVLPAKTQISLGIRWAHMPFC